MATKKPRITITLEPSQHAVLERLSRLQKQSMSGIITDLLSEVTPMLAKAADAMEAAMRSGAEVRAKLRRTAEEAADDMTPIAEAAKDQLDMFMAVLQGLEAEAAAGSAEAGWLQPHADALPEDAVDPRPVITGVNPRRKGARKPPKSASPRVE
jgi:hypothetical protein